MTSKSDNADYIEHCHVSHDTLVSQIEALTAERDDYRQAYESVRENVRKIDVAMHGEDGAAQQASACDLIAPAKALRQRAERLQGALEAAASVATSSLQHAKLPHSGPLGHIDDIVRAALADTQETDKCPPATADAPVAP
jgi:hypothetical protein